MKKNILFFTFIILTSFVLYSCADKVEPEPTAQIVSLMELKTIPDKYVGSYVQVDGVQFIPTDTSRVFNGTSGNGGGSRTLQDCQGNTLVVFTTFDSNYSNTKVPNGFGSIRGRASKFGTTGQINLVLEKDFSGLTAERCVVVPPIVVIPGTRTNIADVRALFTSSPTNITTSIKIRGVVTSISGTGTNFNAQNLTMQDGSAGITVRFAAAHSYTEGDEIEVSLQGQPLTLFNALQAGNTSGIPLTNSTKVGTAPVTFRTVTIPEITSGLYESQLVMVTNARFPTANGTLTYASNSGNVQISDGTNTTTFRSGTGVTWASTVLPAGTNLSVKGIASVFTTTRQILPRKASDLQ
ncbi:MAG: hypothetical protein EAZ85_07200 [Bacteroidetes bacterium]|nr:MAG: hypothetical protein EAZ85_07200 [Bacteroidota bacterium]TAG87255.1 MAG: hypothetical protein EAZ20_10960 [Bacteroidota bacterium]